MTCTCGKSYIVRPNDTFFLIAERELGNGDRWREIMKPDCTTVTEADATRLQPGDEFCLPKGTTPPPTGEGFADLVSRSTYEAMFPNRNSLYSYDSLVGATLKYPKFCNEGSDSQRKQEAAAFLANIAHETTGGWADAPGGPYAWGLRFIEEVGCENGGCTQYCDSSNTTYPCVPNRTYHGRGAMQLSWNYNYGAVGQALGLNLLENPDLVKSNGEVAFATALWFWMTPQSPKPSCHAVMSGWTPDAGDRNKGRVPGFGMTINIINGGLECSIPTNDKVKDRVGFYQRFCQMLSVSTGDNLYCDRMEHY